MGGLLNIIRAFFAGSSRVVAGAGGRTVAQQGAKITTEQVVTGTAVVGAGVGSTVILDNIVTANQEAARTEENTKTGAITDVCSTCEPSECEKSRDRIREDLYANKRSPGETNGYHGLLNRIVEQMCGAEEPGTIGWKEHNKHIQGSWNRLKDSYTQFKKSECNDSLLSQAEREYINDMLNSNNGNFDPNTIRWLGRDHQHCINFREIIQNGRLNDLLGIIRP